MSNPWDDLPSIWDGWTQQCFGVPMELGGYACASGYIGLQLLRERVERHEAVRRIHAVTCWLRANLHISGIVAANDHLRWTPEQFRALDRRLEYEYQLGQIQKQVDAIDDAPLELTGERHS